MYNSDLCIKYFPLKSQTMKIMKLFCGVPTYLYYETRVRL